MTEPNDPAATEPRVAALIEASSLGTPAARRLRQRVSAETSSQVVAVAEASLASADDPPPEYSAGLKPVTDELTPAPHASAPEAKEATPDVPLHQFILAVGIEGLTTHTLPLQA